MRWFYVYIVGVVGVLNVPHDVKPSLGEGPEGIDGMPPPMSRVPHGGKRLVRTVAELPFE